MLIFSYIGQFENIIFLAIFVLFEHKGAMPPTKVFSHFIVFIKAIGCMIICYGLFLHFKYTCYIFDIQIYNKKYVLFFKERTGS